MDRAARQQIDLRAGKAIRGPEHRAGRDTRAEHHRHRAHEPVEQRRHRRRSVAGPHRLDHRATVAELGQHAQQPAVVAEREPDQCHRRRLARRQARQRDRRKTPRPRRHPRATLDDRADRPGGRRRERRGQRGVGLLHEPGRVDLVAQDHHDALPARLVAGSDRGGGQNVRRPVRAGGLGPTHRAGDDHRLVARQQQVEQERRLLDRVRALDDDRAVDVVGQARCEQPCHADHIVDRQRRARDAHRRVRLERGHALETGHGAHQVIGAERRLDARAAAAGHRDGAAERQQQDLLRGHGG